MTTRVPFAAPVLAAALLLSGLGFGASPAASAEPPPTASAPTESRVIGGRDADTKVTPWFLYFTPMKPNGKKSDCGATQLSPFWAVTAAHCVQVNETGFPLVQTGEGKSYVIVNPAEYDKGTRIYLEKIIVHPSYNRAKTSAGYDIALVKTLTSMGNASLMPNTDENQPVQGAAEQVFGFGRTKNKPAKATPKHLQVGDMPDMAGAANPVCGNWTSGYNSAIQLCSGTMEGTVDSCTGDSGGPLTATVNGTQRLVGIVSYGKSTCASPNYPGIYTRVSAFDDWIGQNTGGLANQYLVGCKLPSRLAVGAKAKLVGGRCSSTIGQRIDVEVKAKRRHGKYKAVAVKRHGAAAWLKKPAKSGRKYVVRVMAGPDDIYRGVRKSKTYKLW